MVTEALQKPDRGTLETCKRLYQEHWEIAFAEMMYIMADQYSLELYVMHKGQQLPSPTAKMWKESLRELTPLQMREGLKNYMDSERRSFKPLPGDIKTNGELVVGKDRPRLTIKPGCRGCSGTGWAPVIVEGKRKGVKRCDCTAMVYDGQEFEPEQRALPLGPPEGKEAEGLLRRLATKIPAINNAAKSMPERAEPSDEEKVRRRDRMLADLKAKGGIQ